MSDGDVYHRISGDMAARLRLRRLFIACLLVSLTVNLALSVSLLLRSDHSRTIVLSPRADTAYLAEDDRVSANLLERFAVASLDLVGNMQPATAQHQIDLFLAHVAPESYAELSALLRRGQAELSKAKAATVFFPSATTVDEERGEVCVRGERRVLIARTVTSVRELTVCLGTVTRAGRLWITRLTESES